MLFLILPLGLILPTLNGWLMLSLLERNKKVLFRTERWVMGCVAGLTFTMLVTFAATALAGFPLNFTCFLSVQLLCLIIFGIAWVVLPKIPSQHPLPAPSSTLPRWAKIVVGILAVWVAVKLLVTGITFLLLVPTYLDDTLDNWNLRAKVYYFDEALTLAMPGEDPLTSPLGVSSYPPTVPLAKTWLSTIARQWDDRLINSIHIVWYLGAVFLVFFALRRKLSLGWSLTGTYILTSLPLYLMHGTNAYADAFVSIHVFLAASMLYAAITADDAARRMSFFRIGAFMAALLTFTKNEGLIVYLPPMLLILCVSLVLLVKQRKLSAKQAIEVVLWYAGLIAVIALPWLVFKWTNGLTFGNAKPITSLGFSWQENVLQAIAVNTFFEGNWLFLFPVLFGLLIWRWRYAFGGAAVLSAFFLIVYLGQGVLFLFTALSHEALMQTGYARGLVQLTPMVVLLATLLLSEGAKPFVRAFNELAGKQKKAIDELRS